MYIHSQTKINYDIYHPTDVNDPVKSAQEKFDIS